MLHLIAVPIVSLVVSTADFVSADVPPPAGLLTPTEVRKSRTIKAFNVIVSEWRSHFNVKYTTKWRSSRCVTDDICLRLYKTRLSNNYKRIALKFADKAHPLRVAEITNHFRQRLNDWSEKYKDNTTLYFNAFAEKAPISHGSDNWRSTLYITIAGVDQYMNAHITTEELNLCGFVDKFKEMFPSNFYLTINGAESNSELSAIRKRATNIRFCVKLRPEYKIKRITLDASMMPQLKQQVRDWIEDLSEPRADLQFVVTRARLFRYATEADACGTAICATLIENASYGAETEKNTIYRFK